MEELGETYRVDNRLGPGMPPLDLCLWISEDEAKTSGKRCVRCYGMAVALKGNFGVAR